MNSLFLPAHRIPQYRYCKTKDRHPSCNNAAKIFRHSGRSCKCRCKADHCDHGMADEPQGINTCNNIFHEPDIQTVKNQWNHITSSAHYEIIEHSGASKPCTVPYFCKRRKRHCDKFATVQRGCCRRPNDHPFFFFQVILPFPSRYLSGSFLSVS